MAACRIEATGAWGQARRIVSVTALSCPDALPRGLVVGADAVLQAATRLQGCGLYAGADVAGREWVTLSPGADLAYGGLYQQNGVHAVRHIFSGGVEEHAVAGAPPPTQMPTAGSCRRRALWRRPAPQPWARSPVTAPTRAPRSGSPGLDLTLLDPTAPAVVRRGGGAGRRRHLRARRR